MKNEQKIIRPQVDLESILKDTTQRQALIRLYSLLYEIDQRNQDVITRATQQKQV
jgi:hypothetical protein